MVWAMSRSEGENDQLSFVTPPRGGDCMNTSTESLLTPLNLPKKSTPSKLSNRSSRQRQLEDDQRSPDPLHLARRTNTALTRKRAERERSVYAAKEPRTVIIGFLDRLVGLREPAYVPISGLAVALQDLVRIRNSGHSSQALQQQQDEQMPIVPETPKPSAAFDGSPEMPKWSSMGFGGESSPLRGKKGEEGFGEEMDGYSPAKSVHHAHQSSRGKRDYSEALEDVSIYSQRIGGYRYERMNCDLGFRFDCPIPLKSANLFNASSVRSTYMSQSPSSTKLSIPLRRVTFTTRHR